MDLFIHMKREIKDQWEKHIYGVTHTNLEVEALL